jgi:penicillin-binding protein 2
MAFAPVDRPSIAIAVLAENGGGSSAAYPVARKVMDAWMTRGQDG